DVTAQNNVSLAADHATRIVTNAGAGTFGGTVGFGISNSSLFTHDVTEAYLAGGARVLANGTAAAIAVLTGRRDAAGNELTTPVNGVSLTATSYEDIEPASAGSSGQAPQAGVAASATFTDLGETTRAYVAPGA